MHHETLGTALLNTSPQPAEQGRRPTLEPEPEREPAPGGVEELESAGDRPVATGAERSATGVSQVAPASSPAGEPEDEDAVLLDASVLRTIRYCINGPEFAGVRQWDIASCIGWLGAAWTAPNFYGSYIPSLRFASGFAAFVALLPLTWVPVCRALRTELHGGDEGGFVAQQLQQTVSRDTAKRIHRSIRSMLAMQLVICIACLVQNAAVVLVPGLRVDVAFSAILFGLGFPLGSVRFVGMLATVVSCAHSVSDKVKDLERRCIRHHEMLRRELPPGTTSPAAVSSSHLEVETSRLLSAGREVGLQLGAVHRVLKPVLLATTVFCVAAAIAMSLFGLAAAGRPASGCINEEYVVQAICDLPSIYWYMLAAFIGLPGSAGILAGPLGLARHVGNLNAALIRLNQHEGPTIDVAVAGPSDA